jgi:hypothetical protein
MTSAKFGTLAAAVGGSRLHWVIAVGRPEHTDIVAIAIYRLVILPFAVVGIAAMFRDRWSAFTRTALFITSIVIAVASLAIYGYFAIWPLASTPARTWPIVPSVSLIVIVVVALAARLARR